MKGNSFQICGMLLSRSKRLISSIVCNVLKLKLFSAGGRMRSEPVRECPKISSQPFSHCGTENHFKQHTDRMLQALDYWLKNSRFLCPWDFPGKNTGVGCHFLLQGIFPTQGSNLYLLCLLHCRRILYPLSHRRSFMRTGDFVLL